MPKTEKKAGAIIDRANGIAVVAEPDGRIFILKHDEPGKPQDGKGVHLGMLLQPADGRLETRDTDEFPYPNIYRYLDLSHRQHGAMMLVLHSLDSELDDELRKDCSREAEEVIADDEVYAFVRNLFLKVPLPETADTEHAPKEGRVGALLKEVAAKWGR